MPQATITVAGITPPAPGKKQGKITDTSNGVWNVWGDKLPSYRMGVTYNITYEDSEFNGHKFYLIKTAEPAGQGASAPMPRVDMPSPAAPVFPTKKDEMIFICGAFNNLMQGPGAWERTTAEMAAKTNELKEVFRLTFAAKRAQQSHPSHEMDDEIPF